MANPKPKLLFFATQLFSLAAGRSSGFGGAETEMWNVARQLAKDSPFKVCAMAITDEMHGEQIFNGVRMVAAHPPAQLTYSDPWLKRRTQIASYYISLFRRARQQRATFYFAKLASVETAILWLAARSIRAKFIFRIEHDWETNFPDLKTKIFNGSSTGARLFVACLRRADLVVVQTHRQARALLDNFGVKSILIPNGHIMPPAQEISRGFDERKSILWVARVHPMKRPLLFLELARQNPDLQFSMILSAHPAFESLFQQCKAEAQTLANVTFIPGAPPSEINNFYQAARAFVLTSEAEGFSNVIIEALKNGTPVVSLEHNPNGLLHDLNPQDVPPPAPGYCTGDYLAAADQTIGMLGRDKAAWERCHTLARQTAEQNFGVERVAATYVNYLQKLMTNGGVR